MIALSPEVRAYFDAAGTIATVVLVPVALWLGRTMRDLRDDVRGMAQDLYGKRGTNGLKGAVGVLDARLDNHAERLADHQARIGVLERGER